MSRRTILQFGIPIVLIFVIFTIYIAPEFAAIIYGVIAFLSPIWLPIILIWIAWPLWLTFVRSYYMSTIRYATIELKPGPETPRTARPMELVFYSLYHRTEITKQDFLLGRTRAPWSFEVYAHAGSVRFFVHAPQNHLPALEAHIRAEYHDIEIDPVRDYSREIPFHASNMRAVMREYALVKPDPYPLKTYERYEALAQRRDVFAEMLEEISVVGKAEHFLLSYIVRPHQRERVSYFEDPKDSLHEDAYHVIGAILGPKGDMHALPAGKQAVVESIEAALKKPSFDCGLRALYLADKIEFNESFAQKMDHVFERFNDDDLNGLTTYDPASRAGFLRAELISISSHLRADYLVQLFRRRAFFSPPYEARPFILNTEELATVFHMPQPGRGGVVSHRAVARLDAPENLPV